MRGMVISLMTLDARESLDVNPFTWIINFGPCEMDSMKHLSLYDQGA